MRMMVALLLLLTLTSPTTAQQVRSRGAWRGPDGLPHIDPARLESSLVTLAAIGRDPATGGMVRTAFSEADLEARHWLMSGLAAAGLTVRVDPAGNIIGRLEGTESGKGALVLGSHIDTVPQGGRFDGAVGVLTALEIVRSLGDLGIRPRHPIEVVSFTDEEGGLVGSRAWLGALTEADRAREYGGRLLAEALRGLGLDPARLDEARRNPSELAAYLEVHIEQGRLLEREGLQIGLVEGIVALDEYEITVLGQANHAGTTRMADRHDPMAAAARMVGEVREQVRRIGGDLVGTVGRIEARPGAPNVIPAEVRFTVDIRDPSRLVLDGAIQGLQERFARIAVEEGVEVVWRTLQRIPPAPADPRVLQALTEAVTAYGYPHRVMPSGAGHDAQSVAQLAPMGMLFVPSIGGVSHSPAEATRYEDIAAAGDVLLQAVLLLDGRFP
jgi:N-carbamoyl-L-amino-acid hydrolase